MNTNIFLMAGVVSLTVGIGTAAAGPCTGRIDEITKQLASRDADSGPTNTAASQSQQSGGVASTGSIPSQNSAPAATPRQVPQAGQTAETEATPAMNAATQGRAASPSDVRAQTQGQPTSAQVAQGGGSQGSDNMRQAMVALEKARAFDREGKEADCMSAVQEADKLSGMR